MVTRSQPWGLLSLAAVALLGGGLALGRGLSLGGLGNSTSSVSPTTGLTTKPDVALATALVAARDSVRTIMRETTPSPHAGTFTYVVRRGDTLRGIAWRLYGRAGLWEQLGKANHISDPHRLPVGKHLQLLNL